MPTTSLLLMPVLVSLVSAFPNGASNNGSNPMDAVASYCTAGNFRPNHGSYLPQASPSPYAINVVAPSGRMYSPGRAVTITIEGAPPRKIKGFFLQGDSTESAFAGEIICNHGQGKKVTFCGKAGVTHTNPKPKDKIVCTWSPPDFQIGQIQFTATVLENFTTFWTGVKSDVTLYANPQTMSYDQKAKQMKNKLMQQLQGTTQNLMNLFKQQSGGANPLASMFGGGNSNTNNNNDNANPFASIMSSFQKGAGAATNQLSSLFSRNGGGSQNSNPFASVMGGNTGAQQGGNANYWQQMMSGNQGSGTDLNNFRQYFQS